MTSTSDLFDAHGDAVQVLEADLRSFGGRRAFAGPVVTVTCFEDNSRLKELSSTDGRGRVIVVDGGGSARCALLGDVIGADLVANGWAGVVLHAAVRDVDAVAGLDLGVLALGHTPRRSVRCGEGEVDLPVSFGSVTFRPGSYVYADSDGLIVADGPLT